MRKNFVLVSILIIVLGVMIFSLNVLAGEKEDKQISLDFRYSVSKAYPEIGDKVFFKIQGVVGGSAPYKYQWKMNDEKLGEKEKAEFVFLKAGEYNLVIQVTDRMGNIISKKMTFNIKEKIVEKEPEKKKEPVKVVQPLKCSIEGRINAMPGDTLFWEAKVQGGEPPYRYEWVLSRHGTISSERTASHHCPKMARYSLTLRVRDSKETSIETNVLIVVKNKDGSWPPPEVQP